MKRNYHKVFGGYSFEDYLKKQPKEVREAANKEYKKIIKEHNKMNKQEEKQMKHRIETMEEHIAYKVKYYRKQRGMTQSDLAKAARVSLLTIYQLETCKRIISITTLIKVAYALNRRIEIKFVRDLTGSWSCQ